MGSRRMWTLFKNVCISCSWHTHVSLEEFATFISLQKSASKEPIRHIQPTKSKVVEDALLYLLSFWSIFRSVVLKCNEWKSHFRNHSSNTQPKLHICFGDKTMRKVFLRCVLQTFFGFYWYVWMLSLSCQNRQICQKYHYEVLISGSLHGVNSVLWAKFDLYFNIAYTGPVNSKTEDVRQFVLILQKTQIINSSLTGIFLVIATSQ